MAKPLKVWNGAAWVEVAIAMPSGYASASYVNLAIASIEAEIDLMPTSATLESSQNNQDILNIAGAL